MRARLNPTHWLAAAAVALAPMAAMAQSSPSSDQIIRSLMPQGNMSGGMTRGIRPSAPAAPAPSTAAPGASAIAPQREAVAPARVNSNRTSSPPVAEARPATSSVNLTVEFRTGSADLTPQAARALDELGRALASTQLASYRFRIEGHTDTVGTPDENKALSARRASAVVDYLASKFNVDRARLEAVGMGEEGLLVPTPDQTPEPRNRRVHVINISA